MIIVTTKSAERISNQKYPKWLKTESRQKNKNSLNKHFPTIIQSKFKYHNKETQDVKAQRQTHSKQETAKVIIILEVGMLLIMLVGYML